MKCPHCLTEIHDEPNTIGLGEDPQGAWALIHYRCPSCKKLIFELVSGQSVTGGGKGFHVHLPNVRYFARPKSSNRNPPQPEVPKEFSTDYIEASMVLDVSAKASAALSRRCLQHILREKARVKHGNLASEIQQAIDSGNLPSHICEAIDAIRNIGNFAAHPTKSQSTGEVVPVESGEAEWNLDVLDALFDFYFVQPGILKKRRDMLNQKLKEAGKPEMK